MESMGPRRELPSRAEIERRSYWRSVDAETIECGKPLLPGEESLMRRGAT